MASSVIIVTGASRGIGLAIARYLLQKKCHVLAVARNKEALEKLRDAHPDQVEILAGDLADFSLGQKAVDIAKSKWNRIDALVVNHGVLDPVKKISQVDAEEWRTAFDVNVFSAVAMIKAALPSLRTAHGRVIMTSSGAAVNIYTAWGAYGASKAAINHLVMTLAAEEPNITSISIRPGTVDTEMQREIRELHNSSMDKKDAEKFAGLKENGGLLRPDQPGNVMAKLAMNAPKELSGRFLSWNDKDLADFQDP